MKLFKSRHRGFFNKYHKNMPFFETILKDFNYLALWLFNFFHNNFKSKYILVYPHYPSRNSTIYKVGKILGYNITNKPKKNIKYAVYWEYLTFRKEFQFLEKIATTKKVINLHNRDISKLFIDKIHKKIFGYSTIVNPKTYKGKIVKKNNINAKHDGKIIQAPIIHVDESCIYQILLDNTFSEKLVMDIRVPVVNKVLDFAYIKVRNISERFKNTTVKTTLEPINKILNDVEIKLLNKYCAKLELEYGELDVLRDKKDNRIYVVDVNNTPQGPPASISQKVAKTSLNKIATALQEYIN